MAWWYGVEDLVTDSWNRFELGLDALSDGAQRYGRAVAGRRRPDQVNTRSVQVPGWDDVIHIVPRPTITPEMRQAYYDARRQGYTSPLDPALEDEIQRRATRARLMSEQASPAWAQAFAQVQTGIDNVQDLLTTLVTLGRLTLNPALRGFESLAARESLALAVSGELGSLVLGRAIPILGWILLAADLLKLINTLGLLAFPLYAYWCQGTGAALAAGVPAAVVGPGLKLLAGRAAQLNPFGRKAFLDRSRTIRSWKPSIYNWLEVAQTTDALFGIGLSLGGLYGLLVDSAFGTEQRLRGHDVSTNLQPFSDSLYRLFSGKTTAEIGAKLHDLRVAANTLVYGALFSTTQDDFTLEEHMEFLVATCTAFSVLEPYLMAPEMVDAVNLGLDITWQPPVYKQEETKAWLEAAGLPTSSFGRWPLPGNPRAISGREYVEFGRTAIPSALRGLLEPIRDMIAAPFIGAVVDRITSRATIVATGSTDAVKTELNPEYQIMESLALARWWLTPGDGEGPLLDFFTRCAAWLEAKGKRRVPPAVLQELATATGVRLIRMLPADATPPPEFLEQMLRAPSS